MASVGSTTASGVSDPRATLYPAGSAGHADAAANARAASVAATTGSPAQEDGGAASSGGGTSSNNAPVFSSASDGGFAAELFAQAIGASTISVAAPLQARRVAAAYQTASDLTQSVANADIQVPGLPPRLSSGRLLDLVA